MYKKKFSAILFLTTMFVGSITYAADSMTMDLDKAINFALKNNHSITQYAENRENVRWELSAVRRQHGLRLTWSSSFNYIGGKYYKANQEHYAQWHTWYDDPRYTGSEIPPYHSEAINSLTLTFPLYTGGRLENQIEGAEYALNVADLNLENTRQSVRYQTAEAYYRVLQYNDAIKVQQEAVNFLQSHLDNVKIQYEVGTVAKADVLSTEVQLADYRRQLNSAWGDYETAVANLNNIIGLPVDTVLVTDEDLSDDLYPMAEEDCILYAIDHRPDGLSAAYSIKQARSNVDVTKAAYRPSVSARAFGYASGEKPFESNHNNSEYWQIGLEMQWNIFDNGITSAQVNQAKATERRMEAQLLQQIDQIKLDVHNAYIAMTTADKNVEVAAQAVSEAEAAYAIALIRYTEGVDTNLNVMDAQTKLTQAKNNYFNALYNLNISKAKLEQVMGVPVQIDALRYVAAVENGKTSTQALKESELEHEENFQS